MTFIEGRIKWLIALRKKGGWKGFWSIREEAAEWGYQLGLADVQQYMLDNLTEEEKKSPVANKIYKWISELK
jgi:hypothetical protein